MEKFDLERALAGELVCTRDGRDVTQLVKFDTILFNPIFGVVDGRVESWFRDGSYSESETTPFDLFMKPKENYVIVGSSSHNAIGLHNPLHPNSVKIKNTETMDKFDLQRALAGEPVCTRDGNEVTRLFLVDVDSKYKLVGVVKKSLLRWTDKGYFLDITNKSENDLFMKPKENAIWINVYKNENGSLYTTGAHHISEESAKTSADKFGYLKTIKIVE